MQLLVTGVAGFIGSHVAEALLARGHEVIGVDSFTAWYGRGRKERNLAGLVRHPRFRLVEQDVSHPDMGPLVAAADRVIHLAAQPGVRGGWGGHFDTYLYANTTVTQRLLEHLAAAGCRGRVKLVFASTSSVYGDTQAVVTEAHPTCPISPYGVTKLAAEQLVQVYARTHGIPYVILRYFTVYGPRQRPDMAFHRFITGILSDAPIVVYGDGSQKRDFTYVGDIAAATCTAALSAVSDRVINISGNRPVQLRQVLDLLEEMACRSLRIVYQPLPPSEMMCTAADISIARRLLDYNPTTALEEGLRHQFEHVQQELALLQGG